MIIVALLAGFFHIYSFRQQDTIVLDAIYDEYRKIDTSQLNIRMYDSVYDFCKRNTLHGYSDKDIKELADQIWTMSVPQDTFYIDYLVLKVNIELNNDTISIENYKGSNSWLLWREYPQINGYLWFGAIEDNYPPGFIHFTGNRRIQIPINTIIPYHPDIILFPDKSKAGFLYQYCWFFIKDNEIYVAWRNGNNKKWVIKTWADWKNNIIIQKKVKRIICSRPH